MDESGVCRNINCLHFVLVTGLKLPQVFNSDEKVWCRWIHRWFHVMYSWNKEFPQMCFFWEWVRIFNAKMIPGMYRTGKGDATEDFSGQIWDRGCNFKIGAVPGPRWLKTKHTIWKRNSTVSIFAKCVILFEKIAATCWCPSVFFLDSEIKLRWARRDYANNSEHLAVKWQCWILKLKRFTITRQGQPLLIHLMRGNRIESESQKVFPLPSTIQGTTTLASLVSVVIITI